MSSEANKSLVRRYLDEVWGNKNLAAIDKYLAPHYIRHVSPTAMPYNLDDQKQRLAGLRAAFPNIDLTLEEIFAEGDRVVFRSTLRGTQRGRFFGIAPTGKSVTVALLDMMRIENGKIVEHWGGPDFSDWLRQIGAVITGSAQAQ